VWGADHHGYVTRVKAAFGALGGEPEKLDLVIMQFVHLVKAGERVAMSKRAGTFETLDDLVREVGVDAARWFLLNRSHDTTIEFDLDLATKEGRENPVYYVQYAHARLSKIARDAAREPSVADPPDLAAPERELIRKLLAFPAEVDEAADRLAPHRIATYALELAQTFTAFYENVRVLGVPEEPWRLALCEATRTTIASALGLLGVSAPVEM
jgi:arginyl-tRNA synthetase